MSDLYNKIDALCKEAGTTIGAMCNSMGISRGNLSDLKAGRSKSLSAEKLAKIARFLGVTTDYLLGNATHTNEYGVEVIPADPAKVAEYEAEQMRAASERRQAAIDNLAKYKSPSMTEGLVKAHEIPILGRISAGLPIYAEEHVEGATFTELNTGYDYFALRVSGDSMNSAGISNGDLVIVRRQDIVDNGDIAVVIVGDDDATVKRYYKTDSGVTLMPQSSNPSHAPQVYARKGPRIRVLGKVVRIQKDVV
ncbi:helix-turn-helix domain-containing protein [Ruminococcaceae bacterium OttesenSCG-928-D13]|nr:helix-turn-helix domain-containing protein [Ruminococcaceae bacterium OttesenSCG-928-D13]